MKDALTRLTPAQRDELLQLCRSLRGLPLTSAAGSATTPPESNNDQPLLSRRLTQEQRDELLEMCKQFRTAAQSRAANG